ISLPNDLAACQQQIARCGLDVLYYPEPGMDPLTWMLSFSRLAPVQCAGIGHPVTGGISTVDYFLSDRDLEPENSGSQYTEQLVRLEGCPAWFTRPEIAPGATRAQFGLPDGPLYVCPQEPFRFHPEFDALLAAILADDPTGTLILFEGEQRNWTRLLVQRLSASIPQFLQRVKILPRMPSSHRLQVLQLADVALDTLHSSDLLTAIRLVAAATPVVTWPGRFLRSRATAAVLERLGVTDTIAGSAEEYVRLATGLATSPQWRNRISREISEATPQLFEAPVSTASLERFLLAAVERSAQPPVPLADLLQLPAENQPTGNSPEVASTAQAALPESADGAPSAPVIPEPHFRLSAERASHHVAAEYAADEEF
ncbi:MAG: hypothetical protein KDA79_15840, partial [Planctomycetaceae bacterium]|nr:hypothetical protein [Planctomycetaceae bacterium]